MFPDLHTGMHKHTHMQHTEVFLMNVIFFKSILYTGKLLAPFPYPGSFGHSTVSHDAVKSMMHITEIQGSQVNANKNLSVAPAFCLD